MSGMANLPEVLFIVRLVSTIPVKLMSSSPGVVATIPTAVFVQLRTIEAVKHDGEIESSVQLNAQNLPLLLFEVHFDFSF